MATIRDIAKETGVSIGAVSRILNNDVTFNASTETRKKVIAAAKAVNYNNLRGSAPAKKSAFTMGIVQWFTAEEELTDTYYLRARQGIEDFCAENELNIIRYFPGDEGGFSRLKNVNGLICLGKFSHEEIVTLIKICSNIVFLDMPVNDYNITSLSMDFEQAIYSALNYLSNKGHTKIGFLAGTEYVGKHEKLVDERTVAYKKYMQHRNMDADSFFMEGCFSSASGYEMMSILLDRKTCETDKFISSQSCPPADTSFPTAFVCANDAIAIGAMKAIKERGLRIPEDISIIGFNNDETCEYVSPQLSSINAPAYNMGQHGANLVYAASNLKNHTPLRARIPCELIIRESC